MIDAAGGPEEKVIAAFETLDGLVEDFFDFGSGGRAIMFDAGDGSDAPSAGKEAD
jgi:hypothetical protein